VPNNASAWNYLRGVLDHVRMPYSTQAAFAELYVVDAIEAGTDDVLDLENPPPSDGAELPCVAAIEFVADVHEARGKDGVSEAVKVTASRVGLTFLCMVVIQSNVRCCQFWRSLADTHDTIRKWYVGHFAAHRPSIKAHHEASYWEFRIRGAVANTRK
jgi:protein farnesyltransferase/geranylgeranyltransferase type-1 subunit alpha